jgi:hypothetical protein
MYYRRGISHVCGYTQKLELTRVRKVNNSLNYFGIQLHLHYQKIRNNLVFITYTNFFTNYHIGTLIYSIDNKKVSFFLANYVQELLLKKLPWLQTTNSNDTNKMDKISSTLTWIKEGFASQYINRVKLLHK